jgi:hypothetical protein
LLGVYTGLSAILENLSDLGNLPTEIPIYVGHPNRCIDGGSFTDTSSFDLPGTGVGSDGEIPKDDIGTGGSHRNIS